MEPWQSWLTVTAVGGAAYWYYTNQQKGKLSRTKASQPSAEAPITQAKGTKRRDDEKARRRRAGTAASDLSSSEAPNTLGEGSRSGAAVDQGKKRKQKKFQALPQSEPSAPPADAQDEDENKAWAQRMANVQKGTDLMPQAGNKTHTRTVKASASNVGSGISSNSSTGGVDADDDLSPALSPSLPAGDVSDMLEKPAAGPSVLRLTESARPMPQRQPRPQKEFQPAETKKQRQNRQRVEDARLDREADERNRQVKLENQRRTAREARGEPARNGVPASKAPAVNAWDNKPSAKPDVPTVITSAPDAPLLDTFDPESESTSSSTGALNNSTAATSTASNWEADLPSEEDQVKMFNQMNDDGWSNVVSKKGKKAAGGTSTPMTPVEKPAMSVPSNAAQAKKPAASTNGYASLDTGAGLDAGTHPDDSAWGA